MAEDDENLPRDAKMVKSLLKSMSVEDYEPRVIHQFLELWYRYVVDVLTDSQVYSEHAGKTAIDCDDVKLAIQSKVNFSFSQPPPREVLLELARNRNKIPLPNTVGGSSIPLPPEQDTLISPSYQLAIPRKQPVQAEEEEEEGSADPSPSQEEKAKTDVPPPSILLKEYHFPSPNVPIDLDGSLLDADETGINRARSGNLGKSSTSTDILRKKF